MDEDVVRFEERQAHRTWWAWTLIGVLALLSGFVFVQQILRGTPVGHRPLPDVVVIVLFLGGGVALPLFLAVLRLHTQVTDAEVRIRWAPFFWTRRIPRADIARAEAQHVRPFRDWGGFGIRFRRRRGWAHLAHGGRGVQLTLRQGRPVVVGAQDPHGFLRALDTASSPE